MIQSFKHKALGTFFSSGATRGLNSQHIKKLRQILGVLNGAVCIEDIQSIAPFRCHALTGNRQHEHAVWVNKNWRVTFEFRGGHVYGVDYEDYHDCKVRR